MKIAKWGHYRMPVGLADILFSLHIPETQINNCFGLVWFGFALLKRQMIQPFSTIVNLQA